MAQNENLAELSAAGVAVWLDDLSRDRIRSGNLQSLVDEHSVVGVTTNPTIFAAAISGSDSYDDQLHALAVRKVSVEEALRTITAADVRDACDLLRPVARPPARRRPGLPRGRARASPTTPTPPPPRPAHLWWLVDRPNLFIKIPATEAGLPAITETIANGISVNVTLIFSLERYRAVMDAYLAGLEKRVAERRLARRHRVGGLVLRLPRGHRDRQAPRRGRRGRLAQGQGRHRQRPAGLPGLRGGLLLRPLAGARGEGRRAAAAALGLHRRQEPRVLGHDVHHRAHRPRHRQHDAGEDDAGLRRPRHRRDAGPEGLRRRRGDDAGHQRRRRRPRRRLPRPGGRGRARSSSTRGTS